MIETVDSARGKRYRQRFTRNMREKHEPVIEDCDGEEDYTAVTFTPDLARFGMAVRVRRRRCCCRQGPAATVTH